MVYINWEECSSFVHLRLLKWYSVPCLIDYLHGLRLYIIHGSRKDLTIPVLSSTPVPASKTQRYEGFYVSEAVGDYGYKLDELNLKLNTLSNSGCHRWPSSSEAELKLLGMVNDMIRAIAGRVDVVDQCTFEARYGLVWKTALQDEQEHDVKTCPNIFCRTYSSTVVCVSFLLGNKN
ncbi:hypothetical protein PS15p_207607 [Mucor circinelloides]